MNGGYLHVHTHTHPWGDSDYETGGVSHVINHSWTQTGPNGTEMISGSQKQPSWHFILLGYLSV